MPVDPTAQGRDAFEQRATTRDARVGVGRERRPVQCEGGHAQRDCARDALADDAGHDAATRNV